MNRTAVNVILLCTAATFLGGCSRSTPPKFYLLTQTATEKPLCTTSYVVRVAPVTLASYLDRSELVSRTANHRLRVDELHRWGEPLASRIRSVVGEQLRGLVPPPTSGAGISLRLSLNIARLDSDGKDASTLIANWELRTETPSPVIRRFSKSLTHKTSVAKPNAAVAAQSKLIGDLGRSIAQSICSLKIPASQPAL